MLNDVFSSFRGQDVRKTFLSHVFREFSRKGITWFNNEEEEEQDRKWHAVLRAIAESRVALVVLSKNYASSAWCLDELDKIISFARKNSTPVVPVFYEVDLADVRHQKGKFGMDFERHEQVETPETVKRWRDALTKVTDNPGFSSHASVDDSYLSREITRHVSGLLSNSRLGNELLPGKACGDKSTAKKISPSRLVSNPDQLVPTKSEISNSLVAMDRHMEQIYGVLKLEDTSEIRVIGIIGDTGIGKTSIAKFIGKKLSQTFHHHCFLDRTSGTQGIGKINIARYIHRKELMRIHDQGNVRGASSSGSREESLSPRGLKRKALQTSLDLGSYEKKTSWHQRALVVVDNVETSNQLEEIMKDVNRLGSGSRVILTTQDKSLLLAGGVEHLYEVECLRYDEALELFSLCAFKKQYPPADFEQLSVRAIQLTGCLPLGLKVIGSFLNGRNKKDWERELQRLEAKQDKAIPELSELLKSSPQGRIKEDWECEVRMLETKQDKAIVALMKPIPQRIPRNKD